MGKNWFELFILKNEQKDINFVFEEVLKQLPDYTNYENRIITKNGKELWINWSNTIVRNSNDELMGILGIGIDVTEKKNAEEKLKDNQHRLELITDSLPVLISYIDSNLHYKFVNKGYEEWFGKKRDEVVGSHIEASNWRKSL